MTTRLLISELMLQLTWQQQYSAVSVDDDDRWLDSAVEFFHHGLEPVVPVVKAAAG